MKLSTREDIEAPIDHVYERISDFSLLERSAMRRGVEVARQGAGSAMSWDLKFAFRGKARSAKVALTRLAPPAELAAEFQSGGLKGQTSVEMVALSRSRTRLSVAVEVAPHNLSARILLQSLRLAKMTILRRFKTRIADIAEEIEESYRG